MRMLATVLIALASTSLMLGQKPGSSPAGHAETAYAFRPLQGHAAQTSADIDRRIDAALAAHGLQRSAQADARTLLRRASFEIGRAHV